MPVAQAIQSGRTDFDCAPIGPTSDRERTRRPAYGLPERLTSDGRSIHTGGDARESPTQPLPHSDRA